MTNEEIVLLIQQGQTKYYGVLWERVQRLVGMLISRYSKSWVLPNDIDSEDLHQCGYFALLAAVKAYDDSKGYKFNTYLAFHVKTALSVAVNHGKRTNSTADIKVYSYNETITNSEGEEVEHIDLMQDESTLYEYEPLEVSDLQEHVWQAVAELPDREQEIIRRYYLNGETLTDIAKSKGVAIENIRTRKNKGLQMLRKSRDLRGFYKEYLREPYFRRDLYLPYWSISPERYAIEKDIQDRRQSGKYISYGKEQAAISTAKAEYIERQKE